MAEYFGYDSSDIAFAAEPAAREGVYSRRLKRAFDLLLVLLAAPIVLPVVMLLAFLVRRDGGTAFYRQDRIGKDGRIFRIWKLRSMVPDAETLLAAHLAGIRRPGPSGTAPRSSRTTRGSPVSAG